MRSQLFGAAAALGIAISGAQATDAPGMAQSAADYSVPAEDWSGFYLGIQGGYGDGDGQHSIITDGLGFLNAPFGPRSISGGFFGAQAGYDHQMSQIVIGINAEVNGSQIDGYFDNFTPGGVAEGDGYITDVTWFGSVRGRLGLVLPSQPDLMVYGTGGLAFGRIEAKNGDEAAGSFTCGVVGLGCAVGDSTETGYTVGAGLAWRVPLSGNTVVFNAEYAFYDLGTARISTVTQPGGAPHVFDVDTNFHTGRLGVSVLF